MKFPVGPSLGAGFGAACGTVAGLGISMTIVGGLLLLAGAPQEAGDAASTALAAGAVVYVFPVFALPGIGAGVGALLGALATDTPVENAVVYGGASAAMGFCGGLACLLPTWWAVFLPFVIAYAALGDAILVPGLLAVAAAFVPLWAIATGTVAGASGIVVDLAIPQATASANVDTTGIRPMAF